MATKGADLEIRAKDSATPVIKGVAVAVDSIAPAANKAGGASDAAFNKIKDGSQKAGDGVDGLAKKFGEAKVQVAALAGINIGQGMVKDALATADAVNNLQARIKLATGEGANFTAGWKEVVAIAQRTGSALEQTGVLFTKLTDAGKSAGLSTQAAIAQASTLTETISQAIQLSGGSAESAKAAVTQLVQGLQSGVLRGDEFNSVMEQSPRLAKALADGLGTTTGELRKMAEAGTLSADTVIKSLKGQSATLQAEFATLPSTVGRSVEKLQTQWALYIGDLDKSKGITAKVAQGLDLLAGNLNGVIQTAQAGGAAWLGYKAAQKLVGDGAVDTAIKVTKQAAASAEAAAATTAHGAAAGKAGVQLAGYGAAATATGAQVAAANAAGSTAAAGGFKAATAGIVGFLGNLGSIGAIAFAAYEVTKLAFSAGDALLKKWSGLTAAEDALAAADKKYADTLKESAAAQQAQVAAKQAAIDKTFGLTKESAILVGKFGELVKAGDSTSEAIGKIGKDFDLSTVPGIQAAGSVLDKLLADGKITATQFQAAWSDALKGVDLAELEVKARAAFAGTARGALELQQALDAGVREAIKRTGLDFEVISGGMGKAARSAINDTDAIIKGLDSLKAKGVDTGQALTASLGKGISTADSVKALEVVKSQIEQVRAALGDKVADGLLDQAKTKAIELVAELEKAKPGIQSIGEAMKQLGITSDLELKAIAEKSKTAFEVMRTSGTASVRELQEAFKKTATDAIAANNGVAPEWVKTEAAVRKVTIAVDENGKASVKAAEDTKKAVEDTTRAYIPWGEAAEKAAAAATAAREKSIAALEKENELIERGIALENKRLGIDKYKFSVDATGNRITQSIETKESVFNTAKGRGLSDADAKKIADQFIGNRGEATGFGSVDSRRGENWGTALHKEIDRLLQEAKTVEANAKREEDAKKNQPSNTGSNTSTNTTANNGTGTGREAAQGTSRSVFVNINTPKGPERVYTDDAGAQALVRSLTAASRAAGR